MPVSGGAVVSASVQGFDHTYLTDALQRLGSGFAGVVQLDHAATDDEIRVLDDSGARAIRFNLHRGGREALARLEELAWRVYDLVGWHIEVYVESRELADDALGRRFARLPLVSVDHLGLSEDGFPDLLRMVEKGVYVKASGFGRVDFDVPTALRRIAEVDPTRLIFGSDLPSTRASRPFSPDDVDVLLEALGPEVGGRVLYDNAVSLYKPR